MNVESLLHISESSYLKNYKLCDLYELASGISSKPSQAGHGYPFCSFSTVFNNSFLPDELPDLMDTSQAERVTYSIHEGDVFFTRTSETVDELGMSCVAVKDYPDATYSGFLKRLRPKTNNTYPKYMALYFRSPRFRKMMTNKAVMTLRASFNEDIFNDITVDLPSIEEQKLIGDMFYEAECIIRNNNSISSTLESLARDIYDYWFVQFDFPDENGKPYKSSGGKMVWNEELKREIPEGWEVKRLGDLISYNRGVSYTGKDLDDNGVPIISLASIDRAGRYIPEGIKYYNKNYPDSKVLKPYDLIMANTDMTQERAVMGKIIFVPDIFDGDVLSTHHITTLTIADELKPYLMMTTQTEWFHDYIKGFSSGTNVLGMDMIGFEDYLLLIPNSVTLQLFSKMIYKVFETIFKNYSENQQLASVRDFLLPMLMNGQITFKEEV